MSLSSFHKNTIVSLLRKQAEKLLEGNEVFMAQNLSKEDVNVLLNELQVFQMELEMQNDELKESYNLLDIERTKFVNLFDLAPVGYFILDYLGTIEEANQTGIDFFHISREIVLKKRFQSFISPDSYEDFFAFLHKMQTGDGKQYMEIKLELVDKQVVYTRMEGIAISHILTKDVKYYITVIDVTESRNAQKRLQDTTERLEMTLKASSTGTWTVNSVDGRVYLDAYSYDILDINPWGFDGSIKGFISVVHPQDRDQVKHTLTSGLNNLSEIDIEFRVLEGGSNIKYISAKGHGITDQEGQNYFAGILMDISERKKLSLETENLRMNQHRLVLSATLTAQEKEREKISRALHDSICQILYGIRLNLQNIQLSNNLKGAFKNVNQLLDQAITETRQISYELTPSVLRDFGFTAGIKEMAQRSSTPQFRIKTDIKSGADLMNSKLQLSVFRIIQELINNCIKHSNASVAEIIVSLDQELITVEVADNGIGFNMNMEDALKSGSGLRGIKNRVFLLDGNIEFQSTSKGTSIHILLKNNVDVSSIESF